MFRGILFLSVIFAGCRAEEDVSRPVIGKQPTPSVNDAAKTMEQNPAGPQNSGDQKLALVRNMAIHTLGQAPDPEALGAAVEKFGILNVLGFLSRTRDGCDVQVTRAFHFMLGRLPHGNEAYYYKEKCRTSRAPYAELLYVLSRSEAFRDMLGHLPANIRAKTAQTILEEAILYWRTASGLLEGPGESVGLDDLDQAGKAKLVELAIKRFPSVSLGLSSVTKGVVYPYYGPGDASPDRDTELTKVFTPDPTGGKAHLGSLCDLRGGAGLRCAESGGPKYPSPIALGWHQLSPNDECPAQWLEGTPQCAAKDGVFSGGPGGQPVAGPGDDVACLTIYRPVCGIGPAGEHKTFPSKCKLEQSNPPFKHVRDGKCTGEEPGPNPSPQPDPISITPEEEDFSDQAGSDGPEACLAVYVPVCGQHVGDALQFKTFPNRCSLNQDSNYKFSSDGACA